MYTVSQSDFAERLYLNGGRTLNEGDLSKALIKTINDLLNTGGITNKPTTADRQATKTEFKASYKNAMDEPRKLFLAAPAASVSIVMLGEDHSNQNDKARAEAAINSITAGTLTATHAVMERNIGYHAPAAGIIINEPNLTAPRSGSYGEGLSYKQRSMVVGAYLALQAAGGNQNDIMKVVLFFGENHSDIFNHFEYYCKNTNAAHVLKLTRNLMLIKSNTV